MLAENNKTLVLGIGRSLNFYKQNIIDIFSEICKYVVFNF